MPFKISVSCENRSRVPLPTPFTCSGILKMLFVQKNTNFRFFFVFFLFCFVFVLFFWHF